MGVWSKIFQNRPVWHRIHMRPGDPAEKGSPSLALIKRRICFLYWRWNWVDNPRRAAMHEAVAAWYALEQAMATIKEHEKENQEWIEAVGYHRRSDGVSAPTQAKRIPREPGLIPIPPEWKDVQEMYKRAKSKDQRGNRWNWGEGGDVQRTRFLPDGVTLPSLMLDGAEFKDWNWRTQNQQNQQQGSKRNRSKGKGGNNQGNNQDQQQQHQGGVRIVFDDD